MLRDSSVAVELASEKWPNAPLFREACCAPAADGSARAGNRLYDELIGDASGGVTRGLELFPSGRPYAQYFPEARLSVPISTGGAKSAPSPPRPAAWRGSRRQGIDCVRYFAYAKFVIFEGHWIDSKRLQRLWSAVSLAGSDLRTG